MARIPFEFAIGDKFTLTDDAQCNYHEASGKVYTITRRFDHYCHVYEQDPTGHPGFDDSAGSNLYESADLPFNAVYAWEMEAH